MKNKKGFSLVELLIVIAIIGVLAGLIIPNVTRYLKNSKKNYNKELSTELVSFTKNYYSENKEELPKGNLDTEGKRIYKTLIGASYLSSNNYITGEFTDSEGNDCSSSSYVIVTKDGDDYKYTPCIVCGDNNYTEGNSCNYSAPSTEGDRKDNILPRCTLSLKEGVVNKWTNQNVILTLNAEDNVGLAYYYINSDTTGKGINFNKNTNETKDITINDNINTDNYFITIEDTSLNNDKCIFDGSVMVDKTKPKVDSFTINSNKSGYNAKNTTIKVTSSDDSSGVDKVCITTSNDSKTCSWLDLSSNTYTNSNYNVPSSDGSGATDTLYAFVKDKAGNISDSKSVSYTLYAYCVNTSVNYYGDWGSCSASCGGGTKYRTIYYKDTYFTSHSCGTVTDSTSCNTASCSYSCYRVTPSIGLNCRKSPSTSASKVTAFSQGTYLWYKYYTYNDGYYWYYNSTYDCYSVDGLEEVSSSYCYSGSSSSGSSSGSSSSSTGGITGTCTCSMRFYYVYDEWTPYYYSCSANGLKSSSACKSFCNSKTGGTVSWNYVSSTCRG